MDLLFGTQKARKIGCYGLLVVRERPYRFEPIWFNKWAAG